MNDKLYIESNKVETVRLSSFRASYSNDILNCGETVIERTKMAQKLLNYLCEKYKIDNVILCVSVKPQPKKAKSKTLGCYTPSYKKITIYNLTACTKKVVSIKTFYDTLLHEFMHHYDFQVLKFNGSLHTSGFYKRISDLKQKLTK